MTFIIKKHRTDNQLFKIQLNHILIHIFGEIWVMVTNC